MKKMKLAVSVVVTLFLAVPPAAGGAALRITGVTEAVRDIAMSVPEEGVVTKIYYNVGDEVKKGAPIVELDSRRQKLEKRRRKLIWESKVELVAAGRRAETLRKVMESSEKLYELTQSLSQEEVDRQRLEYELAAAEQRRLENDELREELEYKIAAENYERRVIRAPVGGVLVKLERDVGEYIEPGQPLLQVVDPGKCYMICQLQEHVGRLLKKGMKVDIEVKAGSAWIKKSARVVFVSPVVDQASGLLEVKVRFDNNDGAVRPGVPGVLLIEGPEGPETGGA